MSSLTGHLSVRCKPASTMAASQSASGVVHAESDEGLVSIIRLPAELRLDIYHY